MWMAEMVLRIKKLEIAVGVLCVLSLSGTMGIVYADGCCPGDLTGDCVVDLADYGVLAEQWLPVDEGAGQPDIVGGAAILSVIGEKLDLVQQLKQASGEVQPPLVAYGPRLVAGEGAWEHSHTVVRVLNRYGIAELQFLAYPSGVTGGVDVQAGEVLASEVGIVTCPLMDRSTREVRIFSEEGLLLSRFEPLSQVNAPFSMAVGDFLSACAGDEIALASRHQGQGNRAILIYSAGGRLLRCIGTPGWGDSVDVLEISTLHGGRVDGLILSYVRSQEYVLLSPETRDSYVYELSGLGANCRLFESAFAGEIFVGGRSEPVFSTLWRVDSSAGVDSVDVGYRENCFWVQPAADHAAWTDSRYIKHGRFRHLRTDQASPRYRDVDFDDDVYEHWAGGAFEDYIAGTQADYDTSQPSMWEPTFTHRHHYGACEPWREEIDSGTGLHKYMMLSRLNNPGSYGEGSTTFSPLTYAFDLPAIDHLYVWPLREYVRHLAVRFRDNPEQLVGIEPNHEFEIYVPQDDSIGDYNPWMVSGFYQYLRSLYDTPSRINSRFGTGFAGVGDFDAPRDLGRGPWDEYRADNPFFMAWVQYNRNVVLRRLVQGFRECLLAGFPPEAIKTHQIPADYAIGHVPPSQRITPIDWIFTAGTGYGGTRYGVWAYSEHNWIQGAFSSGQTMTGIGEYHPISENQAAVTYQARYMFEHGVNFIHCMGFPHGDVLRESYLSLQEADVPREGTTGGLGQVRAVHQPDGRVYNIVCIGTGRGRSGLLKSVKADGSWEGTVYVVPFHSQIEIVPIVEGQTFVLTTADYSTGPIGGLMAGDQVEMCFRARTSEADGKVTLLVLHSGIEMPGQRKVISVGGQWGFYRYVLRNQLPLEDVVILLNSGERDTPTGHGQEIELKEFSVLVHKPQVARIEFGVTAGTRAEGGVRFDVLSRRYVPSGYVIWPYAQADLNYDGAVDWADVALLCGQWLEGGQ